MDRKEVTFMQYEVRRNACFLNLPVGISLEWSRKVNFKNRVKVSVFL